MNELAAHSSPSLSESLSNSITPLRLSKYRQLFFLFKIGNKNTGALMHTGYKTVTYL
jgi:hypothetical protein